MASGTKRFTRVVAVTAASCRERRNGTPNDDGDAVHGRRHHREHQALAFRLLDEEELALVGPLEEGAGDGRLLPRGAPCSRGGR